VPGRRRATEPCDVAALHVGDARPLRGVSVALEHWNGESCSSTVSRSSFLTAASAFA
jgi:hypothetical protein